MSAKMLGTGLVMAIALGASALAAEAGILTTGLIHGGSGPDGNIACMAVNASTRNVEVKIEAIGPTGADLLSATSLIVPAHSFLVSPTENIGFCRFTFKGPKSAIRGVGCFFIDGACQSYLQAH